MKIEKERIYTRPEVFKATVMDIGILVGLLAVVIIGAFYLAVTRFLVIPEPEAFINEKGEITTNR